MWSVSTRTTISSCELERTKPIGYRQGTTEPKRNPSLLDRIHKDTCVILIHSFVHSLASFNFPSWLLSSNDISHGGFFSILRDFSFRILEPMDGVNVFFFFSIDELSLWTNNAKYFAKYLFSKIILFRLFDKFFDEKSNNL